MPAVFVSHATKDDDTVSRLHDFLETAAKVEIWIKWSTEVETKLSGDEE